MISNLFRPKVMREALRVMGAFASIIAYFAGEAVALLAAGAKAAPADDDPGCSIRSGVLNFRTGKLDDGFDPYGWYDPD